MMSKKKEKKAIVPIKNRHVPVVKKEFTRTVYETSILSKNNGKEKVEVLLSGEEKNGERQYNVTIKPTKGKKVVTKMKDLNSAFEKYNSEIKSLMNKGYKLLSQETERKTMLSFQESF